MVAIVGYYLNIVPTRGRLPQGIITCGLTDPALAEEVSLTSTRWIEGLTSVGPGADIEGMGSKHTSIPLVRATTPWVSRMFFYVRRGC